jgi:uncharacterized cupin superfamily protein
MNRRDFVRFAALAPLTASTVGLAGPEEKGSILPPDAARVLDMGGGEARILVGAEQSSGAFWLGTFLVNPGRLSWLHVHHSADEQFYVLEGVVSMWMDGAWHDVQPGSLGVVPRGTPHAYANRTKQPMRFLNSGNPAGFERFFADLETIVRRFPYGSPEFLVELRKIYPKYDTEILGPAPQG